MAENIPTPGRDRPGLPEIEVTLEMIEAGVEELYRHPIMEPDDETMAEAVRSVFYRMLEVRK